MINNKLSFNSEELRNLLQVLDSYKTKKTIKFPKNSLNEYPKENITLQEAKFTIIDFILNSNTDFDDNDLLDINYLECPNCGKKMYYFPYYESFGCPKCLYTEPMKLVKDDVRTRKDFSNE